MSGKTRVSAIISGYAYYVIKQSLHSTIDCLKEVYIMYKYSSTYRVLDTEVLHLYNVMPVSHGLLGYELMPT